MKPLPMVVLAAVSFAALQYEPSILFFSRSRTLTIIAPERQNYAVVDGDIWKFARRDLADLRLYDDASQVPFVVIKESGGRTSQEIAAKILNLGEAGDRTEFDLDVGDLPEYDRVRLQMDAKNFINVAQVQGRRTLKDSNGTNLGKSTLYDFTAEGLGTNLALKFPTASFPYLHVRLASGITPAQVKAAWISNFAETKAVWSPAGECAPVTGAPKQSVFRCSISEGVPVERILFTLPASAVNFYRTVVVSDESGNELQRSAVTRVRINRAGRTVTSEELGLDLSSQDGKQIRITVENGDDAPLPIQRVQAFSFERRIYFDPQGKPNLRLYYGDAKLGAPSYDYAKFFQAASDAAVAQLGGSEANAQFVGRPDDRPWSERHKGVLWAAMLCAVALLGALALRGLKSSSVSGTSRR